MEVDFITNPRLLPQFIDGEVGEIAVRVVSRPTGPRVVVIGYALANVSEADERLLLALKKYLVGALEKAKYNVAK